MCMVEAMVICLVVVVFLKKLNGERIENFLKCFSFFVSVFKIRMRRELNEFFSVLCGLVVVNDYKRGSRLVSIVIIK